MKGGKYAVNLTDIIDSKGNSILSSKVALGDLFGVSGSTGGQGSNTVITDNYAFASGKSKTDINLAIQKSAKSKLAAGATTNPTYTYYIDAKDINAQLGLTDKLALPDGYRVKFTSEKITYKDALTELQALNGATDDKYLFVEDSSGNVVARGKATVTAAPAGKVNDATITSGVSWEFTVLIR